GGGRDQADRSEILARIVADVVEEVRPAREVRRIGEQQRVAVGRALGELPRRDRAGGTAAAIFHHYRLAERLGEVGGDRAAHDVVGAARRKRHHQGDGAIGVVGGGRRREADRGERRSRAGANNAADRHAPALPGVPVFLLSLWPSLALRRGRLPPAIPGGVRP